MILENLKDFEWYNEPQNVIFGNQEMKIVAACGTDFWQSRQHNFMKDNGHFFYSRCNGDFTCIVKWHFDKAEEFNQCGIMVRADAQHWFKASVMSANKQSPEIGTVVTNQGYSDWANVPLPENTRDIWYKIVRQGKDYVAFYSLDGENYTRLRQFCLIRDDADVSAGAYICCPQNNGFEAVLAEIFFS